MKKIKIVTRSRLVYENTPFGKYETCLILAQRSLSDMNFNVDLRDQPKMHYRTGDYLLVYPSNPTSEVTRLLDLLSLTSKNDHPITIKPLDLSVKLAVPSPTTLSALFTYYLELTGPVSRETMRSLASFSPSENAKNFLLSTSATQESYSAFLAAHPYSTITSLLTHATPTSQWAAPIPFLLEVPPRTRPRYYSISSSAATSPKHASTTVAVNTIPFTATPSSSPSLVFNRETRITGLATSYLSTLQPDSTIHATIHKSKFRLPTLSSHPLIIVASGTDIAPFRAFIAERARLAKMGRTVGRMIMFFGCRGRDDFLYEGELSEHAEVSNTKMRHGSENEGGEVMSIVNPFSREGDRLYVQDRVRE